MSLEVLLAGDRIDHRRLGRQFAFAHLAVQPHELAQAEGLAREHDRTKHLAVTQYLTETVRSVKSYCCTLDGLRRCEPGLVQIFFIGPASDSSDGDEFLDVRDTEVRCIHYHQIVFVWALHDEADFRPSVI
mgnify:CR=1 FL=1